MKKKEILERIAVLKWRFEKDLKALEADITVSMDELYREVKGGKK